ncbi:MAG: tRNA (adenosine(37)-N6)-threonylcarbamoyltransferase complex dimerization subunit type 1 TsaB [Deltaproteobacteria bacterium]|nr:tRNA (adenosine(37)-N6)-threonylcarbamoyltransferase complex dimerization subunit type 1 TsaB [Deltaproteobacteria bacterium]
MLTLAFDSSSKTTSVALLKDEHIIYDVLINVALNHSEVLMPAIDQACIRTGIKIDEIDLFACTLGPGSFTGLRIGASTLKGFMLATGKPAVGISSLAALALNTGVSSKIICSVMDAGRGQVYVANFHYKDNRILMQIGEDQVLNPLEIRQDKDKEVIFVGDGAVKYSDVIRGNQSAAVVFPHQQYIRASSVGVLAIEKYKRNELLDAQTFVPLYLRSADALVKKPLFNN